eukprot:CAMPEP_0170955930 /NCGR_PEP_ID=MMETSP0735-20130129/33572_1 /TAXON_ID=186038 /ORGANISM="Fragilariopsis kerguelensis, Strain L26-C5" /LENGTH=64 /DNA_ID=CAMNT_0011368095 /DNA_START=97 /DNA_END=288 /DNA_ORIENTATION=-
MILLKQDDGPKLLKKKNVKNKSQGQVLSQICEEEEEAQEQRPGPGQGHPEKSMGGEGDSALTIR